MVTKYLFSYDFVSKTNEMLLLEFGSLSFPYLQCKFKFIRLLEVGINKFSIFKLSQLRPYNAAKKIIKYNYKLPFQQNKVQQVLSPRWTFPGP